MIYYILFFDLLIFMRDLVNFMYFLPFLVKFVMFLLQTLYFDKNYIFMNV